MLQHIRLGLEIDHQIRRGYRWSEHVEITLVEFQLFVVEIDVREDLILLEKEIADDRSGAVFQMRFEKPAMALVEEIHLRAESGAGLFIVKLGKERILLAIENAPRVHLFGKDACECGFADANRPFNHDIPRRLKFGAGHGARL